MLWPTNPRGHSIDNHVVHVWKIPLRQPTNTLDLLKSLLSADELHRAQRFIFDVHRERFVVARGALRMILGTYVNLRPEAIRFDYNRQGKPAVNCSPNEPRICFNMSHSADLALCAIRIEREVGIDIEALRQVVDADRMAARYFDPLENASYQQLPASEKLAGFLSRWTMKEAYIKARGQGLSIPLDQFTVSPDADAQGFHRVRSTDFEEGTRWAIKRIWPLPGYVAAIAAEGNDWQLVYRQWPEELEPLIDTNQR